MGADASYHGIHWKEPTLMVVALCLGIGVALSQHFFYSWLDGRAIDGSQTPFSQAVNLGLGTAMAFLVRSFLVFSIGIAYCQLFWRTLRIKEVKISRIDSLFTILSSLAEFFQFKLWVRFPTMMLIALVSWLLPLSAVVAPATLTTRESTPSESANHVLQAVPKLDFTRNSYAELVYIDSNAAPPSWNYVRPQPLVERVMLATSAGGAKLTAPVEVVNSSYAIEFYGPKLSCENARPSFYSEFTSYISYWVLNVPSDFYDSWIRASPSPVNDLKDAISSGFIINPTSSSNETAALYLAVRQNTSPATWSLLTCELFNTSYVVDFENINGVQTSIVRKAELIQGIKRIESLELDLESASLQVSPSSPNWQENWKSVLSYQAIFDALVQVIIGRIQYTADIYVTDGWIINLTSILSTNLAQMEPLYSIVSEISLPGILPIGLGVPPTPVRRDQDLKDGIEELFQNITLSLLNLEEFRLNYSDGGNHALTNVSVYNPYIVYKYTPRNLFIAYGLATLFTALIVALGAVVVHAADGSFSNNFSTIMRTTRGSDIDSMVPLDDRPGKDPLPKNIGKSLLSLSTLHNSDEEIFDQAKNEKSAGKAESNEGIEPVTLPEGRGEIEPRIIASPPPQSSRLPDQGAPDMNNKTSQDGTARHFDTRQHPGDGPSTTEHLEEAVNIRSASILSGGTAQAIPRTFETLQRQSSS